MESKQIFSREISINKSFYETYDCLMKMPQIQNYSIISENRTMGKVIISQLTSKIEVLATKVSDSQTTIKIMVMDKNSNYLAGNIATNEATNFENAFAAILDDKPESFVIQELKIDGVAAFGETIAVIAGAIAIGYGIYAYFH